MNNINVKQTVLKVRRANPNANFNELLTKIKNEVKKQIKENNNGRENV